MACAELHLCARPHSLDNARLCTSNSKQDTHDARSERRAEHLAEHGAAAFLLVLERKDAAIGQDAEIKPRRIRNAPEAEAAFGAAVQNAAYASPPPASVRAACRASQAVMKQA